MSKKKMLAVAAASAAFMLVASGCAAGTGNNAGAEGEKKLSFQLTEPKSLVPHEDPGSQVAMATCANLMEVNSETQKLEPLAAKSVTSKDAKTWKIALQDGWTFQDGTPVTANSFVDAWNKTATGSNAWQGNGYFATFVGYKDLNPTDGSKPKTDKLSGVKVIDENNLEVTLTAANADFPKLLSTSAMCPLPEAGLQRSQGIRSQPDLQRPVQVRFLEPQR